MANDRTLVCFFLFDEVISTKRIAAVTTSIKKRVIWATTLWTLYFFAFGEARIWFYAFGHDLSAVLFWHWSRKKGG
ncbi:MAG: hypothetical protein ABIH36_01555 [bacterium]